MFGSTLFKLEFEFGFILLHEIVWKLNRGVPLNLISSSNIYVGLNLNQGIQIKSKPLTRTEARNPNLALTRDPDRDPNPKPDPNPASPVQLQTNPAQLTILFFWLATP